MRKITSIKLLSVALLSIAVPCLKADIVITWQGNIISGTDFNNTFGGGLNSDLAGLSYIATYTVDTSLGDLVAATGFASINGGTAYGAGNFASPLVSSILNINGQNYSFGSTLFGGYTRNATGGISQIYSEAQEQNGPAASILFHHLFLFNDSVPFPGLNESLNLAIASGATGYTQAFNSDGSVFYFSAGLSPTNVSIDTLDPNHPTVVPEPGSTALLILVCGGLAAYARRRNRCGQRPTYTHPAQ
jgi:hypothetical protein